MSNNSDIDSDEWFTVEQLASLNIPGYPRSSRRIHDRAQAEGWKVRKIPSAGRTGERSEYAPPPEVMELIEARQSGKLDEIEEASSGLSRTLRRTEKKNGLRYINVTLLARCLEAVDEMAGVKKLKPLSTERRLAIALDAYRELTQRTLPDPLDLVAFSRLGKEEFAAAATFALWASDDEDDKPGGAAWIISSL